MNPDISRECGHGASLWSLWLGAALLLSVPASVLILGEPFGAPAKKVGGVMLELPAGHSGWSATDEPLGATLSELKAVKTILNYDEVVNRVYRKDGLEFGVYAAYWQPGKMSVRDVAAHVPDICWQFAGWKIDAFRTIGPNFGVFSSLSGGRCRVFKSDSDRKYVAFWHMLDGRPILYSEAAQIPWSAIFTDALRFGKSIKGEQYLIRITSNRPLEELPRDPLISAVVAYLSGKCVLP